MSLTRALYGWVWLLVIESDAKMDQRTAWSVHRAWAKTKATVKLIACALVMVAVSAFLAELLPPVKALHAFTETHEEGLTWLMGSLAAVGFVLFMGTLVLLMVWGRPTGPWRARVTLVVGVMLLTIGLFGVPFVAGPPFLKVLIPLSLLMIWIERRMDRARSGRSVT